MRERKRVLMPRMKIGIVSPYDYCHPGGVVLHISYLAHHFMKMGHEVKIIAPCSKKGVSYFGEEVIPIGRPFPWPVSGSIARVPINPWLGPEIKRILEREAFDVLHLHEPYTPVLAWYALNRSNSVNVATFHAFHTKARAYWVFKYFILKGQKRLARQIAVSGPALTFVNRHLPARYTIIPNGVDEERFTETAPARPELRDGKRNIVFVGRLEKRKGVNYLIEAYEIIKKKAPDTRLVIAGPGDLLRKQYEQTVADKGLTDVQFIGFVPSAELPSYYRSADVFCAPALYGESFGIVLLEAMASGVPVVASDIEGYNSVLTHGKEGLLVPPRDPAAIAEAVLKLLDDKQLSCRFAKAGVATARGYTWDSISHKVMDCYLEAIAEAHHTESSS